jgi:CheY-like chemotaxis protein
VFHEARAMNLSERALEIDPNHEGAASLWLASNFSREIDSPEGYRDPAYDRGRSAEYYAVAAGSEPAQRVLARALAERDTPLARRVIDALSMGAGGAGLWEGLGSERPLIDALSYPDRRVQYEAALAIGRAKPRSPFPGSERVTPILAGAVRNAADRYAVVIATDPERRQDLFDALRALEYDVLQTAGSLEEASSAIAEAPGVDMIVADLSQDRTLSLIDDVRSRPKLRVTPVLALLPQRAWNQLWPRFENDPLTRVSRAGLGSSQVEEAIRSLAMEATGPRVTQDEAEEYALRALDVLRDLAISRNPVFGVEDAAPALIESLDETQGEVRMRIADVLARVDARAAQVALMDAALDAEGPLRVDLLQRVSESAKAYGNRLEERQVRRLLAIATGSENDAEATAAAALVGVLNLPQSSVTSLILENA